MAVPSIYWQEGMFMWPHHMQQEVRLQGERGRLSHKWNVQHNWGLRSLELDSDALKNGRLVVRRLQARMRDGTLVDVPEEERVPFLDLKEAMGVREDVTILLAIPELQANRSNVAAPRAETAAAPLVDAAHPDTRYRLDVNDVEDENTGEDPQTLQFRSLNLHLFPDSRDVTGYDVLPIARIQKVPGAETALQVDVNYIPPLLACDAWKVLMVDILQSVFHHFSARMGGYAEQVLSRGVSFDTHGLGDSLLLGQLSFLNEAVTVLNTMAFAEGIHPFPAYLELCRMVGQLAIFTGDRRAPILPAYDHDDLAGCFYQVKRYLEALEPTQVGYVQRSFIGEGLRMQVAIEAKWLEPLWQVFVGVQSPIGKDEVIRLLTKEGHLDMKIGSKEHVDEIFTLGFRGLEFTPILQPPRVLPVLPGLTYFQVNRDSQKEEWARVMKSLSLAIRLNQNMLVVNPQGTIQGQRVVSLAKRSQGGSTMQFSLFLFPEQ